MAGKSIIGMEVKMPDQKWWDNTFYGNEINDARSISKRKCLLSAKHHYSSVERLICMNLYNTGHRDFKGKTVFDAGCGAGHWIKFYDELGADEIYACDISKKVVEALYHDGIDERNISSLMNIYCGEASQVLVQLPFLLGHIDIVNAIGLMFHITDDEEWEGTLQVFYDWLRPGGMIILSGDFNRIQRKEFAYDGTTYKVLRTVEEWFETLKKIGFRENAILSNASYIHDTQPQNNLLIAHK